ncbi:MAG: HAMP domain-containing histidine kinase [Lachnospiraceae bacterium]|nr:HAMP domain-containing histidine kinase [Lachnospiraceae bacterium]
MDWIDSILESVRIKGKNISLQKSMIFYMLLALLAALGAIWFINEICSGYMQIIRRVNEIDDKYVYTKEGVFVFYEPNGKWNVLIANNAITLPEKDERLWEFLTAIKVLSIPICSVGAICLVALIYYHSKLQEPLYLLKMEMEAIGRNDLSYSCYYDSQDEMGDICKAMDSMRCAVQKNQQGIWELIEEQRKINAAFAHDLRTPLTVIIGYTQMLSEYYRAGKIEEEVLLDTLTAIEKQAVRMQRFAGTMKDIHHFEMLEVEREHHTLSALEQELHSFITGLKEKTELEFSITVKGEETPLFYDENVVMEILANLLSNALRYGKKKVDIIAEHQGEWLDVYVRDDGRGMTKQELYKADSPYYSDKTAKDTETAVKGTADSEAKGTEAKEHMGLGLTICKILCKKHGGQISFSNSMIGGAIVCARFRVN